MRKTQFVFSLQSKIILYGAASIGHLMFTKFSDAGYKVAGFIDKRAEEIEEYLGVPVWSILTVPESIKKDENTVIFLAVKNVFEHNAIAAQLVENGFFNLIYKPYHSIINHPSEHDKMMSTVYEQIFNGGLGGEKIIDSTLRIADSYDRDYGMIQQEGDYVTALIPVDFIFTNDYQNTGMEKWGNINILAFFTHLQFYDFLQGNIHADYKDYLNEYCVYTALLDGKIKITDEWKNNVLHNRAQIYDEMCRSLLLDNEFFIRVPPQAEWNEKGYFNLVSGKHRATFLTAKQRYLIPLKIKKQDYLSYLNMDGFEELRRLLSKRPDGSFYVPHPYCYRPSAISYTYYGMISAVVRTLARKIYSESGSVKFSQLEVLDDTGDNGIWGAYFARMGSSVTRYTRSKDKTLTECVWKLGHVDGKIREMDELPEEIATDVLIIDLINGNIGKEAEKRVRFLECFAICKDENQVLQWMKKCHVANMSKLFNTFQEDGVSLLYWLH